MISRIVLRRVVHASSVSAVLRVSAPSPRWQVACRRLSGSAAALPQPAVDGDDAAQALLRLLQMADASSTPGSEGGREGPKAGDREPGTQGREGPAGDGAPVASNISASAAALASLQSSLKPREVVSELDRYIVGQADAKRAVAVALRNRWRRQNLSEELRGEIVPKNILMIGPTGCGKTEIARRMAKLSQAPFIKVEATKFTETGFHGKDVDQIIKDLVEISISLTRKRISAAVQAEAEAAVEERLLDCLISTNENRETFRTMLRNKALEDQVIEVTLPERRKKSGGGNPLADLLASGMGAIGGVISSGGKIELLGPAGGRGTPGSSASSQKRRSHSMKVSEARPLLLESVTESMLDSHDVTKEAIEAVEQSGIVFIDEIDKLVSLGERRGPDASSEGVQRDLLPIIEGCSISTKHGDVNTDYILFIASGAFHACTPSDLLAELQGRLPVRVTLQGLTEADLYRILTEPVSNLLKQQIELLKAENFHISFSDDAVREIAKIAYEVNRTVENIGARRLHTIVERVIEDLSFAAPERPGESVLIDAAYVRSRVSDMLKTSDLRKYIL